MLNKLVCPENFTLIWMYVDHITHTEDDAYHFLVLEASWGGVPSLDELDPF